LRPAGFPLGLGLHELKDPAHLLPRQVPFPLERGNLAPLR
jgi:hypothetical protein